MKAMKRKLCAILCAVLLAGVLIPSASAATFTDTSSHWAASYIETCAGRGIVDGVGGGKFEPEGKVTNAQFVKMLCSAFFAAEEQTFENENRAAIDDYFGGSVQWYAYKSYYFQKLDLLNNVDYNIQSAASANQPMNRTNMAQVAANVLKQKGIAANEQDKAVAQANLVMTGDYFTIPESNRSAVMTCYALGIITGTDGGKFDGVATMTRAQACTVITRLLDVVGKGLTTSDSSQKPTQPVEPTVKDIAVTTASAIDAKGVKGTAYTVADNGYPTGYLNNGKAITEANVRELLEKAKTIWPDSMTWTTKGAANNNWYINNGISRSIPTLNSNYACAGYAAMLSDYLFGKTNNPWRQSSLSNVKPGDIIATSTHSMIVIDTVKAGDPNGRDGAIYFTDGNRGNVVTWPEDWPEVYTWSSWDALLPNQIGTCTAYTRYPD